ncbi:flagellum-associated coiled-coil domain-containing protein 1 [Aplysia californica]|uniref:Flagellum-associated coiled-coil domain-containing protein 1 n=1 Tax=Aplysia californica TaxID=6500 RepID=A0ABM0JW08_APLCA|nr:flagellum-associated coiled-coil domain-containing protein 1 [Aplysia californica]
MNRTMPSEHGTVYSDSIGFDHQFGGPAPHSGRPSSALNNSNSHNLRWGHRPKSTPISASPRHGPGYPASKISRPKTAAVILGRTDCDRVQQLEHEPTRRHNLENHLPPKRTKPPPWQKNLETPLVPFVVGPGYILSRSKTKCHVTIKDEFFDPIFEENNKKKPQGDPERFFRKSVYYSEEFLKDKVDQMTSTHQEHVRDMDLEHREDMLKQKRQMEEDHREAQASLEKQIARMAKEIEFLQGAFESYKSTLHMETADKWNSREAELKQKCADEKQQALHDLKMRLTKERNQEMASTNREHSKAMEALRKENKREMDSLIRRFSNAAGDIEKLRKTTAELEETKSELDQLKEAYNETCIKLTSTTRMLTDAKVRLMDFEERFQERVAQVDDKYRHKLEELMTQNTELKRLFVQKCGELFDEKSNTDNQTSQRVKTAKEAMETLIKSKQRANVNLAVGGPLDKIRGGKTRPLSAPGTRSETHKAHVTAGETDAHPTKREFIPPDVNVDSNPETEEMRAELFSGPVRELSKEELLKSMSEF